MSIIVMKHINVFPDYVDYFVTDVRCAFDNFFFLLFFSFFFVELIENKQDVFLNFYVKDINYGK